MVRARTDVREWASSTQAAAEAAVRWLAAGLAPLAAAARKCGCAECRGFLAEAGYGLERFAAVAGAEPIELFEEIRAGDVLLKPLVF